MQLFKTGTVIAVTFALAILAQSMQGQTKNGFDTQTVTVSTQGNSGKPVNTNASDSQQGISTTETTATGPKGALKNGNTPDSNVTTVTTTSGPGKSK